MTEFNEIVVKLKDENKRLLEDLNFERNLNNILENIRNNSLILIQNCKCSENQNTFIVIKQFNSIYTDLKAKQNLLKLNENQISLTKSRSSDKSDQNFRTNSTIKAIQQKSVNVLRRKTRQTTAHCLKTGDNEQTINKSLKPKTSEFKTDSNSSFSLITELLDIKVRNNEVFGQISDVLSVTELKDSQNTTDFQCNECEDCFESESDLEIHVNREHDNCLEIVCPECQEPFNSYDELSAHSSQTHPPPKTSLNSIESKPNQRLKPKIRPKTTAIRINRQSIVDVNCCGRCHQRFQNRQLLLSHTSVVHNIPVFECDLCDYRTERKQTLFRHKEAMHSSDRPYKCPVVGCDKWFKTKHNISAHKKKVHFFFP